MGCARQYIHGHWYGLDEELFAIELIAQVTLEFEFYISYVSLAFEMQLIFSHVLCCRAGMSKC